MAIVLNGSTGISTPNIDNGGTITASGITVDNTNPTIKSADADGFLNLSGGTTGTVGTQIRLYAESHATAANDIIFRSGGSAVLQYNASTPVWNFQAEDLTTTGTVTATSYTEGVFAITGSTPALDPSNGSIQTWQLTAGALNPTDSFSSGESMTVMITNSFLAALVWPAAIEWAGGSAPQFGSSLNAIVLWKVGSTLYGSPIGAMS